MESCTTSPTRRRSTVLGMLASYAFEYMREPLENKLRYSPMSFRVWRAITKPLRSHLVQGDVYLHLANVIGLPFDQIVYLYEFKANQMTKEFTVKYDRARSMRHIAKAEQVKYAVENGIPPECIKGSGCKQCNAFPQPRRRTVAGTRINPAD